MNFCRNKKQLKNQIIMTKKTNKLTDEQRVNMLHLGVGANHKTTEADVLKILRKKKFQGFNQGVKI